MSILQEIKRLVKKFLPHSREYYSRMVFQRVSPKRLAAFLEDLGVQKGSTVMVHSAFSTLGYFPPGPIGFITLLKNLVGEQGTIVMPAFPFAGSMQAYVESQPEFDVRRTPSKVGYLTEIFRQYPGVIRSLHPTHSVCALGQYAREIVEGHENIEGPCGTDSPFDKLVAMHAQILRMGTYAISHLHHVQERLNYPNLFLPEPVTLPCKNYSGKVIQVRTRVYRSQIPYILFLGESSSTQKLYLHPIHFPLLFAGNPGEASLSTDPQNQEIATRLLKIRALFEGNQWLKQGEIHGCACDLFSVKQYVEYSITEEKKLIEQFKDKYELAALEYLLQKGEYPR